ncbi:MAG TPA: DnaJ domain-containing protein [Spirochaetota bacterium]|nr:DnaJ domain-containing protein [Spirochaetota bacterium]
MLEKARDVLGIDENATINRIRSAYRALWQERHPDTGGAGGDGAMERLAELKRSYDILIRYCEEYEISFDKKNAATREYDHMMRFYDGWIGDLKK